MAELTPLELVYAGSIQSLHVENETNISGNDTLYIVPNDDRLIRASYSNNIITSIRGIQKWNQFKNLASLTYKITTNKKRSGVTYLVEISFTVPRIKHDVTQLLSNLLEYKLTAIIKDNNNNYFLLGLSEQLEADELIINSTDSNQYEVKLSAVQRRLPQQVAPACIAALGITGTIYDDNTYDNDGSGTDTPTPILNNKFPYTLPFQVA